MSGTADQALDDGLHCACENDAADTVIRNDAFIFRAAVATALAGQGMVVGLGYNNARLAGEAPAMDSWAYWGIHGFLIGTVLTALLLLGKPLLVSTARALFNFRITVEALFSISLLGALTGSLIATFTGGASVYYEVVIVVLLIYSVGRRMGVVQRQRLQAEVRSVRQHASHAWRLAKDRTPHRVPVSSLAEGDLVVVPPGEMVTVSGVLEHGSGFVRETAITGSLTPVRRKPGDTVEAGSWSVDSRLVLRLDHPPEAGRNVLGGILDALQQAEVQPSRLQEQADRITKFFVPFVVAVSGITFACWIFVADWWWQALFNSMAVLLIACPCALGLAMPVGLARGFHQIGKFGLHTRNGRLLDGLALTDRIIFDKTGTLSEEVLQVTGVDREPAWQGRAEELDELVTAMESMSGHPLARALSRDRYSRQPVRDFHTIPGAGITAAVGSRHLHIGDPEAIAHAERLEVPEKWPSRLPTTADGRTVGVWVDGEPAALYLLEERWRGDLQETFDTLRQLGIRCDILTGDRQFPQSPVEGVHVKSGLLPDQKRTLVADWAKAHPRLLYIGDGVNDAAAMAAAPLAIAMENAAPLTQATAQGVLCGGRLAPLPAAIIFARGLRNRLYGNMRYALVYNTFGMGLAAAGKLHPVVAALIMVVSSAWVTWRALKE